MLTLDVTVDANVFVSTASVAESQHQVSLLFFGRASALSASLYCPTILLPEVAAGIARPTGDAGFANRTASSISSLPDLVLVELDELRAGLAADAAVTCRLRGRGCSLRHCGPRIWPDADYLGLRTAGARRGGSGNDDAERLAGGEPSLGRNF